MNWEALVLITITRKKHNFVLVLDEIIKVCELYFYIFQNIFLEQ